MKPKMPMELDVETTYNVLFGEIYNLTQKAKKIFHSTDVDLLRKQEMINHLEARACGLCDAIRILGYEIRTADGDIATSSMMSEFFYYSQMTRIAIRKNESKEHS